MNPWSLRSGSRMVALETASPRNEEETVGYPHGLFGWADVAVPDTAQAKAF